MKNITFIIAAVILIAVAVISNMPAKFNAAEEPQMASFPIRIGDWKGEEYPLTDKEYAILETKNLIMRSYKNVISKEKVTLYIIYSSDNRKALHPPEICYTGGGGTILEKNTVTLGADFKANKFIIEDKNIAQLVVYWFKSGDLSTYSYLRQQLKIVKDRLMRRKTSAAMIRMSTLIDPKHPEKSMEEIQAFSKAAMPFISRFVP